MCSTRLHHRRRPRKPRVRTFTRRDARLRMLADNSPDIYFSLRFPEGRYEYISPAVETLCGHAPQDFYRDAGTLMRCVAPHWRDTVTTWLGEIAKGKVADAYEFEVVDRQGGLRWLRQRQIYGPTPDGSAWLLQGVATDITELRQAQRQLRDSEAQFRQLIELWPDQVVLCVNLDAGRHEYVSPSMEHVMGYAPQEFYDDPGLGMRVVAPGWQEQARSWMEEINAGVLQPGYEFELVHKNGEHRWIHQLGILRPSAPGQDRVVQFTFRDITETKRAQHQLLESEARFREMAESWTEQVLMRFNLNTSRHEYVSPGITRIFGYRPEEFYAQSERTREALLPRWRPVLEQWLEENRRGILRSEYEYEVYDAWGNRRWVLMRGSLLRDKDGKPAVLQAVLCDNTERRKLEDALVESNRRYRLLSDNLVDVIWAMDAQFKWTYLSPSAEHLTGRSLSTSDSRGYLDALAPGSRELAAGIMREWSTAPPGSLESGPRFVALDILHADGGLVPVEVLARPVRDDKGRITGYCGTARDIRPRRRMERVEASLSRLSRVLLECEDLAQSLVLAAACAEEVTGAHEVLAAHRDPEHGLLFGVDGKPQPERWPDEALCAPVLHAGEELGRLTALGVASADRPGAQLLLERVASLLALAMARIRAEEALRRSERTSRKLLESMHEGVWAVDREGETIFVNEHLARMLGYKVAELVGMNPSELLDDAQRLLAGERGREQRLGLSASGDFELTCKNGTRLPVHISSSPILDEGGGYEGLVCTALDLSERKRMEEELRRNQARFEALYELSRQVAGTEAQMAAFTLREGLRLTGSTAGVLFFVSADGGQLNPMAWHGAPNNRRIGPFPTEADTPWAVVYATRLPLLLNDFSLFGSDIPHDHIELTRFLGVPALDGDRPVAVLGLTGKAEGYTSDDSLQISLLMDGMWRIIRSRRDEEHIRASLREKEALLREVHHRVKNNLQVVSSLLDMAGRRLSDGEARRCLEAVRAKVQAMSLVHAQLHSRGSSGPTRGIDLERYVRSLFRQLREIYSGDMTLAASISLEGLVLGLDQAVPLGLALNEALTNVFKHARREDRPGQVDIRARREADGRVCIELRDDGPGLPPDLEPERTPSLGMKLMFGLVRHQLGGELTLQNAPEGVLVSLCFRPHVAD